MSQRKRTPKEKLEIVLEGLRDGSQVAEVCGRRGICEGAGTAHTPYPS